MVAKLFISQNLENRVGEIKKILDETGVKNPHPDLLYFPADSKLGIGEARKIKEHFSFKSFGGISKAVVLEDASNLTPEAQNALLKTLEELPKEALFLLGAASDSKLLPTVLSRCQIIRLPASRGEQGTGYRGQDKNYTEDLEKLLKADLQERFEYVEKLKDKEGFHNALMQYFHQKFPQNSEFLKELLQTEQWANQNVNIRAILEYLMLVMPKKVSS